MDSIAPLMLPHCETFAHGSDIGVRGVAASPAAAFEQAARALTGLVTDVEWLEPDIEFEIECLGEDLELLLVDFLNGLIFRMATERVLVARAAVRLEPGWLRARVWAAAIDVAVHRPVVEPKGATFTELRVAQRPDGAWIAQCVIDV